MLYVQIHISGLNLVDRQNVNMSPYQTCISIAANKVDLNPKPKPWLTIGKFLIETFDIKHFEYYVMQPWVDLVHNFTYFTEN